MSKRLISACQQAVKMADIERSGLPKSVLDMEGMSSHKVRHLLANITEDLNSYIEIGVWKGSTFFSAIYNKMNLKSVAIDNWSEFDGPKDAFKGNLWFYRKNISDNITLLEKDFHDVNELKLGHYECLLYDGNHAERTQLEAIMHMSQFMQNEFIYIVDDYSWPEVKQGTVDGIRAAKLDVLWEIELQSSGMNDPVNYWNGMLVSVLRKTHVS